MNQRLILILIIGALAAAALLLMATPRQTVAQDQSMPTIVPAEALTPAPTPEDGREIALLMLVIEGSEEKVESVQLERGQILNSYAPNVTGRPGPWTVEVVGAAGELRYGVQDPRYHNVYAGREQPEEEKGAPHSTEFSRSVTWELVVPLYDDGKDLQAKEINIYDREGELIFSTEVDREGWAKPD